MVVGSGLLSSLAPRLERVAGRLPRRIFVVTSPEIWALWGDTLSGSFAEPPIVLFLPPGEKHKTMANVEKLARQMVAAGGDRGSLLIALGGGIVGDVGGFLAAIFMRGIPVLQIPTTLLGQVDAAVGGKTGVNLVAGKNLIGNFHQPLAVLIDPAALDTLPAREYRAGLFEVIKCGVIRDPALFDLLEREAAGVLARQSQLVDQLIAASVCIKADVVSAEPPGRFSSSIGVASRSRDVGDAQRRPAVVSHLALLARVRMRGFKPEALGTSSPGRGAFLARWEEANRAWRPYSAVRMSPGASKTTAPLRPYQLRVGRIELRVAERGHGSTPLLLIKGIGAHLDLAHGCRGHSIVLADRSGFL